MYSLNPAFGALFFRERAFASRKLTLTSWKLSFMTWMLRFMSRKLTLAM